MVYTILFLTFNYLTFKKLEWYNNLVLLEHIALNIFLHNHVLKMKKFCKVC